MSTIASPRLSISSRRTSTSTDNTTSLAAPSDRGSLRRNRAALRDYYGLKAAAPADVRDTPPATSLDVDRVSEIDRPDFDASSYVTSLLSKEGLDGVLKVEAGLVSEIRSLDGEKKALVYDNYSKLIAATDTIRRMRETMDPLTPTTNTLGPAIGHIAETAATLSTELSKTHVSSGESGVSADRKRRGEQQATVRWVLGAPQRLGALVEQGQREEAEKEWKEVAGMLEKWNRVRGVEEVRNACLEVMDDKGD